MGLTIGLSFCLLVVGAAITSAWVLFVDLVFVLCLPIIIVLFHMVNPKHDNWEDMTIAQRQTANFGTCVVAAVMSCLLGLPLVLLHTGEVRSSVHASCRAPLVRLGRLLGH